MTVHHPPDVSHRLAHGSHTFTDSVTVIVSVPDIELTDDITADCQQQNVDSIACYSTTVPESPAAVRAVGGLNHLALQGTDAEHERYTRPRFIEAYKNHAKLQYLSPSQTAPLRSRVTNRDDPILIPCEYEVAPRIEHTSDSILNRLADKVSIKKNPKSEN